MDQTIPSFKELDELYYLIETTFDKCKSNTDELYWLIAVLKILLNYPNQYTEYNIDNIKINYWILKLYPIFEKYKKRWHHSTEKHMDIYNKEY